MDLLEQLLGNQPDLNLKTDVPFLSPAISRPVTPSVNIDNLRRWTKQLAGLRRESLNLYIPREIGMKAHASLAKEKIIGGSNQSGKTTWLCAELARAFTGTDPFNKYPRKNGIAYLVGYDMDHLGRTLYKKLFEPGAFEIIRDLETRKWRPVIFSNEEDMARRDEWKPADPMIPPRFIKKIKWDPQAHKTPQVVVFSTGWELYWHSSKSHPEQGTQIDILAIDEMLEDEEWYVEGSARLQKRDGWMIWSATDQDMSSHLIDLKKRSEDPESGVESFHFSSLDNPFVPKAGVERFAAKLNEDEYEIRILGKGALGANRIFPEFVPDSLAIPPEWFPLDRPPDDWCNIMVIDPGFNPCAVLFASMPPPSTPEKPHKFGDIVVFWDELYMRRCTPNQFGDEIAVKTQGLGWEAFIIDMRGAIRMKDMATTENAAVLFEAALAARGIRCRLTGSSFQAGSNDPKARILGLKNWLHHRPNGAGPKLRILKHRVRHLIREFEVYRIRGRRPDGTIDDRPVDRNDHLVDCSGMLAQYQPRWHRPIVADAPPEEYSPAYKAWLQEEREFREERDRLTQVHFGPERPYENPW